MYWKLRFFFFFGFLFGNDQVYDDAEDKGSGNLGDGDLTDLKGQAADAGDENGGDDEQVSVLAEVDFLDHLKTGNRDEAVKRDAHAAHDGARDR